MITRPPRVWLGLCESRPGSGAGGLRQSSRQETRPRPRLWPWSPGSGRIAPARDAVVDTVLSIVAEKTGYPQDMLDLDLDLEADLGIDTVKQAETFQAIRQSFAIPFQEGISLRDYPTLEKVIGFVHTNRPDLVAAAPAPVAITPSPTPVFVAAVPVVLHRRPSHPQRPLAMK